MPLTEAVWPQFTMQVFGGAVDSSPECLGGMQSCRGLKSVPQGSGRATLFCFFSQFVGKT